MAWSVLALTLGGSSLLYLLIQRGAATAGDEPAVPGAAVHRADGVARLFGEAVTPSMLFGMALCATAVFLVRRG